MKEWMEKLQARLSMLAIGGAVYSNAFADFTVSIIDESTIELSVDALRGLSIDVLTVQTGCLLVYDYSDLEVRFIDLAEAAWNVGTRRIDISACTNRIFLDAINDEVKVYLPGPDKTLYYEETAHVSGDEGQFMLSIRDDDRTLGAGATGRYQGILTDKTGNLWVDTETHLIRPTFWSPTDFSVTFTTDVSITCSSTPDGLTIDDANCIVAMIMYKPSGGEWQKPIINGRNGVSITAAANVITVAGLTTAPFAAADSYVVGVAWREQAVRKTNEAYVDGHRGKPGWAVRQDVLAALIGGGTPADGDYYPFKTNALGELYVDVNGAGAIKAQGTPFPITHWSPRDFSAAYTSNVTITCSGAPFTIADGTCWVAFIYYKPSGGEWQDPLINGNDGVSITAAANVITVAGAGTPFAAADEYFIGVVYDASKVQGSVGHGTTDDGNPVKVGAIAKSAYPTAVTANQRVNLISDLLGRLMVLDESMRVGGNGMDLYSNPSDFDMTLTNAAKTFDISVDELAGEVITEEHFLTAEFIWFNFSATAGQKIKRVELTKDFSISSSGGVVTVDLSNNPDIYENFDGTNDIGRLILRGPMKPLIYSTNALRTTLTANLADERTPEVKVNNAALAADTYAYYVDMSRRRQFSFQAEIDTTIGGTTSVVTITVEATWQDDGTVAGSCVYQDKTLDVFGLASFICPANSTMSINPVDFWKKLEGAKYVKIKVIVANEAASVKIWSNAKY